MPRPPLSLRGVIRRRHPTAAPGGPDPLTSAAQPPVLPDRPSPAGGHRRVVRVVAHVVTVLLMLSVPAAAYADTTVWAAPAPTSLGQVIGNLQAWIIGILAALATLFLVLAGVYWTTAGGDPAQVDKAKQALKNALVGYALAVLAPLLLEVVQGIVGG